MEDALLLAKFWGLLMLGFAFICLLRPRAAEVLLALAADENWSTVFGLFALTLGAGSLAVYSSWQIDWRLALTLLGWSAMAKAVMRLGYGREAGQLSGRFAAASLRLWLVPILFLGAWLLAKGLGV